MAQVKKWLYYQRDVQAHAARKVEGQAFHKYPLSPTDFGSFTTNRRKKSEKKIADKAYFVLTEKAVSGGSGVGLGGVTIGSTACVVGSTVCAAQLIAERS